MHKCWAKAGLRGDCHVRFAEKASNAIVNPPEAEPVNAERNQDT
jgi:hypothetical protein